MNDMNDLKQEIAQLEADLCNAEFEKKCSIYKVTVFFKNFTESELYNFFSLLKL